MHFQWYPGHMTKAKRAMQEDIKLIDVIIELVDARIPRSSKNPDIDSLAQGKSRILLLNKSDMADAAKTQSWISYYEKQGFLALAVNSKKKNELKQVNALVQKACEKKIERDRKRGIKNRPVRAMIVGIPNVGKSTFINSFAGKACAKTGNKPGVTKGKQWIRLNKQVELLDTPGILWPKFEDQVAALRLAATGAIAGDVFDADTVVSELMRVLARTAPDALREKYGIEDAAADPQILLAQAGKRRGCILPGGAIDYARAQTMILNDFRSGKLGRITLDAVPAEEV